VQPILGTAAIVEAGDTVVPAGPPHTYLGVAQQLMPSIATLATCAENAYGKTLLCGHAIECVLKAYITRVESGRASLKTIKHHNLMRLWAMAATSGPGVTATVPAWLAHLNHLYAAPYRLRYANGYHGAVLLAAEPMVTDLRELLTTVSQAIASRPG